MALGGRSSGAGIAVPGIGAGRASSSGGPTVSISIGAERSAAGVTSFSSRSLSAYRSSVSERGAHANKMQVRSVFGSRLGTDSSPRPDKNASNRPVYRPEMPTSTRAYAEMDTTPAVSDIQRNNAQRAVSRSTYQTPFRVNPAEGLRGDTQGRLTPDAVRSLQEFHVPGREDAVRVRPDSVVIVDLPRRGGGSRPALETMPRPTRGAPSEQGRLSQVAEHGASAAGTPEAARARGQTELPSVANRNATEREAAIRREIQKLGEQQTDAVRRAAIGVSPEIQVVKPIIAAVTAGIPEKAGVLGDSVTVPLPDTDVHHGATWKGRIDKLRKERKAGVRAASDKVRAVGVLRGRLRKTDELVSEAGKQGMTFSISQKEDERDNLALVDSSTLAFDIVQIKGFLGKLNIFSKGEDAHWQAVKDMRKDTRQWGDLGEKLSVILTSMRVATQGALAEVPNGVDLDAILALFKKKKRKKDSSVQPNIHTSQDQSLPEQTQPKMDMQPKVAPITGIAPDRQFQQQVQNKPLPVMVETASFPDAQRQAVTHTDASAQSGVRDATGVVPNSQEAVSTEPAAEPNRQGMPFLSTPTTTPDDTEPNDEVEYFIARPTQKNREEEGKRGIWLSFSGTDKERIAAEEIIENVAKPSVETTSPLLLKSGAGKAVEVQSFADPTDIAWREEFAAMGEVTAKEAADILVFVSNNHKPVDRGEGNPRATEKQVKEVLGQSITRGGNN